MQSAGRATNCADALRERIAATDMSPECKPLRLCVALPRKLKRVLAADG
jgi:hypothetical protein